MIVQVRCNDLAKTVVNSKEEPLSEGIFPLKIKIFEK